MGQGYGEKKEKWHLEIPIEMNNLRLCESDMKSSNPIIK